MEQQLALEFTRTMRTSLRCANAAEVVLSERHLAIPFEKHVRVVRLLQRRLSGSYRSVQPRSHGLLGKVVRPPPTGTARIKVQKLCAARIPIRRA